MRFLLGVGVVAGFAASAAVPVSVSAGSAAVVDPVRAQAIVRGNACLGCHAVDRRVVGPSFQQIAAKYKGDAGAEARLIRKVKDGGSEVWGAIPMPSHPAMNDADIRTVVDWVLAGAPASVAAASAAGAGK
ncbi:c-type cytochrome [Paraburkholderia phosphatilytica]|uniref:c-type cytochrome n=1 Tax=Paraburkholderia phosphatilytica TaxID=2282883 RepID=UPI001F0BF848|nr:c-type cytochrome [Paraburkholderia phosphatilytica]